MTFFALIYYYFVLFIFHAPLMEVMNFIGNCHVPFDNKEVWQP
jgi:hypothetical protein